MHFLVQFRGRLAAQNYSRSNIQQVTNMNAFFARLPSQLIQSLNYSKEEYKVDPCIEL
jgi:hypothetical protein